MPSPFFPICYYYYSCLAAGRDKRGILKLSFLFLPCEVVLLVSRIAFSPFFWGGFAETLASITTNKSCLFLISCSFFFTFLLCVCFFFFRVLKSTIFRRVVEGEYNSTTEEKSSASLPFFFFFVILHRRLRVSWW